MIRWLVSYPHVFPLLLQGIYVLAAVRYAFARDWARVGYWISALAINACVTFGKFK